MGSTTTVTVFLMALHCSGAVIPEGLPRVAESGIATPEDAAQAATWGYSLALVGTSLMKSDDPGGLIDRMLEAGRRVRSRAS